MPSFAKALPYLLLLSALTTWPITTNITAHPRFLSDGGHSKNHRRVGKNKNSKKQNAVQQCTPEQFVGDYKYRNCQGVETKVSIVCDKDNGTKHPCDYAEAPLKNDTNDGCVVKGSFGATHIMMDPANPDVCQLNFVALKDSCKADSLPSGLFGMRAEVDMTASHTDTSTSTLVLWFSIDGGVVYQNEDKPREAVFLHHDLPSRRKLEMCDIIEPEFVLEPEFYAGPGTSTDCSTADGATDVMCWEFGLDCGRVGKKEGTDEWVYRCCKHGNYRKSWSLDDYCRKPVGEDCKKDEECEHGHGCGMSEGTVKKKCCKHGTYRKNFFRANDYCIKAAGAACDGDDECKHGCNKNVINSHYCNYEWYGKK